MFERFWKFMASQLRRPSGVFGRWVVAGALNRANSKLIRDAIFALKVEQGDSVLELGFGGGASLPALARLTPKGRVTGVDISSDMVERAKSRYKRLIERGRLELTTAEAANLPFPSQSFERALSLNTIYFWEDAEACLSELKRVLKPGGRLILGYGEREHMQRVPLTRYGFKLYSSEEVCELLEGASFRNIHTVPSGGLAPHFHMLAIAEAG